MGTDIDRDQDTDQDTDREEQEAGAGEGTAGKAAAVATDAPDQDADRSAGRTKAADPPAPARPRRRSQVWKGIKRLVAVTLLLGIVLLSIAFVRSLSPRSRQPQPETRPERLAPPISDQEAQLMAEHLGQVVRFPTVSYEAKRLDGRPVDELDRERIEKKLEALSSMHDALLTMYPLVHQKLKREVINGYSLLYTWPGQNPQLPPYLLLAHQDVVPVEPGTESRWEHPPFSGAIADGYIWGRGTLDDKNGVIGILEAAERLLRAGFTPQRTLYLAFGHDEESLGVLGAQQIVNTLQQRGVHLSFVLDEGQAIVVDVVPGVKQPVALIGLTEKGYLSLELSVQHQGGHSATPPRHTAIGQLARALVRLESRPFRAKVRGAARKTFDYLSPEFKQPLRMLFGNLWLFEPLLRIGLGRQPGTNAMLRTTIAPTMLEGSPKDNVMPQRARAVVNFRIAPGETVQSVTAQVRAAIADKDVQISELPFTGHNPAPESSDAAPAFQTIARSIKTVFPDALVAPSLMLGASDSRYFTPIADQVYRFVPEVLGPTDLPRFHGTNERVGVQNFANHARFYEQVIRSADAE